jgi:hypothetical protein
MRSGRSIVDVRYLYILNPRILEYRSYLVQDEVALGLSEGDRGRALSVVQRGVRLTFEKVYAPNHLEARGIVKVKDDPCPW